MPRRERWLYLSAVFLPLSTAVGAVYALVWLVKAIAPGIFTPRAAGAAELLIGMACLVVALLVGFLAGTVVFVLAWRPFVPRATLEGVVSQPSVPGFSPLLRWLFRWTYPAR